MEEIWTFLQQNAGEYQQLCTREKQNLFRICLEGKTMTASHSEKDIFEGCVDMMQRLMGAFEEYLDWMDVHPENEEEKFSYQFYNTEIVERIFLWNTTHSGGTSQREKCRELGIKDDGTITFRDERETD